MDCSENKCYNVQVLAVVISDIKPLHIYPLVNTHKLFTKKQFKKKSQPEVNSFLVVRINISNFHLKSVSNSFTSFKFRTNNQTSVPPIKFAAPIGQPQAIARDDISDWLTETTRMHLFSQSLETITSVFLFTRYFMDSNREVLSLLENYGKFIHVKIIKLI